MEECHQLNNFMNKIVVKMAGFFNQLAEQCLEQGNCQEKLTLKEHIQENKKSIKQYQYSLEQQGKQKQRSIVDKNKKDKKDKKVEQQRLINKKPKQPVSSFFLFYKQKSQSIGKQHGETVGQNLAKLLSEIWKKMSQQQKQPYETLAKLNQQKYLQEMNQFREKHKNALKIIKQQKRLMKQEKKQKQKQKKKLFVNKIINNYQHRQIKKDKQQHLNLFHNIHKGQSLSSLSSSSSSLSMVDMLSNSLEEEDQQITQIELTQKPNPSLDKNQDEQQEGKKVKLQNEKKQDQVILLNQLDLKQDYTAMKAQIERNIEQIQLKGPISPFFLFHKLKGLQFSKSNKKASLGRHHIQICSQIWKSMKTQEKQIYLIESKKIREKFSSEKNMQNKKHGNQIEPQRQSEKSQHREVQRNKQQ